MYYNEENNYPKAFLISGGVMVLFLLVSYFIVFGISEPQIVGTGGIVVNYGTSPEGMGDDYMSVDEPSASPDAPEKQPEKVVPEEKATPTPPSESNEKSVVTQETDDAPAVKTPKKDKPATVASTATKEAPKAKAQPEVNQSALYKGPKKTGMGKGDGTGTTPGNQGDPDGDPLASNYGSGGSGFGNVKLSLANRRFLNLPKISDDGQTSGRICVEIRVDKLGEVVFARAGVKGTTLSDQGLWRKCEQAVLGARLNQLESAPDVQIGVIVFNFKVK